MTDEIEWLTTAPNPKTISFTADAGQRGWVMHAINIKGKKNLSELKYFNSLCGLIPRHGWGMDLFIETKCLRCLKAIERLGK